MATKTMLTVPSRPLSHTTTTRRKRQEVSVLFVAAHNVLAAPAWETVTDQSDQAYLRINIKAVPHCLHRHPSTLAPAHLTGTTSSIPCARGEEKRS
jgi:hypothetical protein